MVDREKVIDGLARHLLSEKNDPCNGCPYFQYRECVKKLGRDAIALLKTSFTPKEVYDTVVEHAQHDKRFKLGDKIDYSFRDVVDILNMELMCKAGDV